MKTKTKLGRVLATAAVMASGLSALAFTPAKAAPIGRLQNYGCGAYRTDYPSTDLDGCTEPYRYKGVDYVWPIGYLDFAGSTPSKWTACSIDIYLYKDGHLWQNLSYSCLAQAQSGQSTWWQFGNTAWRPTEGRHYYQTNVWWSGTYNGSYVGSAASDTDTGTAYEDWDAGADPMIQGLSGGELSVPTDPGPDVLPSVVSLPDISNQ